MSIDIRTIHVPPLTMLQMGLLVDELECSIYIPEENIESVSVENWKPAPDPGAERERLARRAERHDRYEQVVALRAQGLGNTEIAQRVGLSIRTVQRWQTSPTFPEAKRRRKRQSSFDPYAAYVLKRWEEGCHKGLSLWREIKDQGYTGSEKMVYRFLVPLRKKQRIIQKAEVPHAPLQDFRATDAVWLFARDPADLDEKEQETVRASLTGQRGSQDDISACTRVSGYDSSPQREAA